MLKTGDSYTAEFSISQEQVDQFAEISGDKNPLHLDSKPPSLPYREFLQSETRFNMLWRSHPQRAEQLLEQSENEVHERYHRYQQLASLSWEEDTPEKESKPDHSASHQEKKDA